MTTKGKENRKDVLNNLRVLKAENESNRKEIIKLKQICFALSEIKKNDDEKSRELENEKDFRLKHLESKIKELKIVENDNMIDKNKDSINFIKNQKLNEINFSIETFLNEKFPEFSNIEGGYQAIKTKNKVNNEYNNLVFDNVLLTHTAYEINDPFKKQQKTDEKQYFRINAKTKFKTLKMTACILWDLDEKEYQITDDIEAIINEDLEIESFLKFYSVQKNSFKLVHCSSLKNRNKLMQTQEYKIRELNTYGSKDKKNKVNIHNKNT